MLGKVLVSQGYPKLSVLPPKTEYAHTLETSKNKVELYSL